MGDNEQNKLEIDSGKNPLSMSNPIQLLQDREAKRRHHNSKRYKHSEKTSIYKLNQDVDDIGGPSYNVDSSGSSNDTLEENELLMDANSKNKQSLSIKQKRKKQHLSQRPRSNT